MGPYSPLRSVVVDQVHVDDLVVLEPEHYAPVAGDADAPLAGAIPLQGMQPESRSRRVAWLLCFLEPEQYPPKP